MVDQPVGLRPPRRPGFGTDVGEAALGIEDQRLVRARLILTPGEQAAATDNGFHRVPLRERRAAFYSIFVAEAPASFHSTTQANEHTVTVPRRHTRE
jgi:hypothetical protein